MFNWSQFTRFATVELRVHTVLPWHLHLGQNGHRTDTVVRHAGKTLLMFVMEISCSPKLHLFDQ